jgi:hypothetical protein
VIDVRVSLPEKIRFLEIIMSYQPFSLLAQTGEGGTAMGVDHVLICKDDLGTSSLLQALIGHLRSPRLLLAFCSFARLPSDN